MQTASSPLWRLWFVLTRVCSAVGQGGGGDQDPRSLTVALENISGMSSIFSLLPVLTGKTQNVKAIAARTFPGSLSLIGLGAGRVLSKLQIGIMLTSANLYRNVVGELSYYHQEYVNAFSPALIHVPTGTPERHSSNTIVNHNVTEDYMVEAWFQTQGLPAKVELSQGNNWRVLAGILVYLSSYAFETFLCAQNAATGTVIPLIILQVISGTCWVAAICVLQAARGQGKRFIFLNRLANAEYRCFQLVTSGKHVHSAVLSTQLSNIREYNLFNSKYESKRLQAVGVAIIVSGIIDIFTTVLVVGLNAWAFGWLGLQVVLIIIKVVFSLEPIRRIPIVDVQPLVGDSLDQGSSTMAPDGRRGRLPITVDTSPEYTFVAVLTTHNIVVEVGTQARWISRTPGIFIGQPYFPQRPEMSEKPMIDSAENIPKLPHIHVSQTPERTLSDSEKPFDPAMFPLPPSPAMSSCASPTSSDSGSTVMPFSGGTKLALITEVPRIVVSPESPVVASPVSPLVASPNAFTAPPGIPITRSASNRSGSARSMSTRPPTPPAKPPSRSASRGPPPVSLVTRNNRDVSPPAHRHLPIRSQSHPQPLVVPVMSTPMPIISAPQMLRSKQDSVTSPSPDVRYLALKDGKLTMSETEPVKESNQALQREFLACLAEVVKANKVPSVEFMEAVETMREGIRLTMADNWYAFGATDLLRYMHASYLDIVWRRFV